LEVGWAGGPVTRVRAATAPAGLLPVTGL